LPLGLFLSEKKKAFEQIPEGPVSGDRAKVEEGVKM